MALLGRTRRVFTLLAIVSGMVAATAAAATDGDQLEYAVKASYVTKFGPFVEWPASALGDGARPLRICVVGADPFGSLLDQSARGQRVRGHPLEIVHMDAVDGAAAATCAIMVVGTPTEQSTAATLRAAEGAPVLTVTDRSRGVSGGIIDFVIENGRVRFAVDEADAQRHDLKISSKLLALAVTVNR
jgi:hypothetical protein